MKKYVLVTAMAVFVMFTACNTGGSRNASDSSADAPATEMMAADEQHAEMNVGGSCEMCKDRIEKVAGEIEGVTLASYDLENEKLHFHFDGSKTKVETVSKALAAAGHDTDNDKAPDDVYNSLPGCCKYRDL
ncbi:MAG: cation transporter [Bacteroidia bacterium]|nr:cation transporter [Bacteroidia bacterium]